MLRHFVFSQKQCEMIPVAIRGTDVPFVLHSHKVSDVPNSDLHDWFTQVKWFMLFLAANTDVEHFYKY